MTRENTRVAFCLGDTVEFSVISDNVPFTAFHSGQMKLYLYNSVKYYEIVEEEYSISEDDEYVIKVSLPPSKTEKMLPGDYDFVVKGCLYDVVVKKNIETSARIMNAIRLDWSPARKDHFAGGK